MMIEEMLKRVGIPPAADYVRSFHQLVRWARPGRDYLARRKRAAAAFRVGDYATALDDARWCVLQRPEDSEAHLQRGLAALGAVAADIVPLPLTGAGINGVHEDRHRLLEEADKSFRTVLEKRRVHPHAMLGLKIVQQIAGMSPADVAQAVPTAGARLAASASPSGQDAQ